MTSISALSSHHHHTSPLQRLQDELQTEVSSGAISSSDQSALSSALAAFGASVRGAIDHSDEIGDKDTADIFTEISRGVDKYLWFLEAHRG